MIANYFNVNLLEQTRTKFNTSDSTFFIHMESKEKLSKVITYFDKYPLYTKKSLSYKLWKDIHNDLINKDHLDESKRREMIEKTKMINKSNNTNSKY